MAADTHSKPGFEPNSERLASEGEMLVDSSTASSGEPKRSGSALQVFLSTFITILLAEIGDKTQITTLLMTAESHSPWIVFAGAGSALVVTSLLGVLLGRWLASRIMPRTLDIAAGSVLLTIAALLIWEVVLNS